MKKNVIVGSRAFFSSYADFTSKDVDVVKIVDNPKEFKDVRQLKLTGKCVFMWRRMSPEEFIEKTLSSNLGMSIGKFLVPDFVKEIGFTLEHLRQLEPILDKLDDKHSYERTIYNSYISNGGFFLTDEQRNQAYKEYKKYRDKNEKRHLTK